MTSEGSDPDPLPRTRRTLRLSAHPCAPRAPRLQARPENRIASHGRARSQMPRPHEEISILQGRGRNDCTEPPRTRFPGHRPKPEVGDRCHRVLSFREETLSLTDDGPGKP